MTDVRVRHARADDLPFVAQDGHAPDDHVASLIARQAVWVAESAEQPIGYLRLEYLWGRLPFIALVRVLPEARGRGAGRALLEAVEQQLRLQRVSALYSSSQADEPGPQSWHRHTGFTECGIIAEVNEGGVDEVIFRKRLEEPPG